MDPVDWRVEHFNDLSGVWLEADFLNFLLSVEFRKYGQYVAYVSAGLDDFEVKFTCNSIDEATQVAEDMVRQIVLDQIQEAMNV